MSHDPAFLPDLIPPLMDRLRNELAQYGEMLTLLDQQQDHVMNRAADEVMHSVSSIHEQMTLIQQARTHRESAQKELARALQKTDEPTFAQLIPNLPEKYQGAVQIMVRENNLLRERVHQKACQNHLLLARSLEKMRHFLNSLSPAPAPIPTMENGRRAEVAPSPPPFYEALG